MKTIPLQRQQFSFPLANCFVVSDGHLNVSTQFNFGHCIGTNIGVVLAAGTLGLRWQQVHWNCVGTALTGTFNFGHCIGTNIGVVLAGNSIVPTNAIPKQH